MGIIKSIHNRWQQTYLMLRIILLFGVGIAYSQEDCMGMDNDSSFCIDEDFVNSDTLKKSIHTSPSKYTVFAFRSNLLAPLMNVGVQVPIGNKWSVGADYYYPWAFRKDDHKNCFQLLGLNMEGRYWFGANRGLHNRLKGHSVGVTIGGGYFDFEKNFKGDQGEYLLIGADYLYAMPVFKGKLHLEFSLGLGYIYSSMRPYEVFEPGGKAFKKGYSKKNHWAGPVKAAISLVIPIKKKRSHE